MLIMQKEKYPLLNTQDQVLSFTKPNHKTITPLWTAFPPGPGIGVIIPTVIPESATPDRVHNHNENQKDDVQNGNLLPVGLEIGHHTGLARLAVIAERRVGVTPCCTVRIGGCTG